MPEISLQRENERELVFANRPATALMLGVAFAVFGYVLWAVIPDRQRWALLAVALVAVGFSVAAMLRRERLVLDLVDRRYLRERGYWPRPERRSGPLSDVEHVELTLRLRGRGVLPRASRRQQRIWVVSLKLRGHDAPIDLLEERSERKAYLRLEALAEKLETPALDRTGVEAKRIPWEQAGRPLAERLGSDGSVAAAVPPPPAASGIRFRDVPGRRRIDLPRHGLAPAVPVLYLLPGALIVLGAAILWHSLDGALVGGFVLAAVFLGIGLWLAFMFSAALFGHEWIAENRDQLVIGNELAGFTWWRQRTAKQDVRAIEIRALQPVASNSESGGLGSSRRTAMPAFDEVVLRSTTLLRRFGIHLTDEGREWLRDALRAMVHGG